MPNLRSAKGTATAPLTGVPGIRTRKVENQTEAGQTGTQVREQARRWEESRGNCTLYTGYKANRAGRKRRNGQGQTANAEAEAVEKPLTIWHYTKGIRPTKHTRKPAHTSQQRTGTKTFARELGGAGSILTCVGR